MLYDASFLGGEQNGRAPVRLLLPIVAASDDEGLKRALKTTSALQLNDTQGYELRDLTGRRVSGWHRDAEVATRLRAVGR